MDKFKEVANKIHTELQKVTDEIKVSDDYKTISMTIAKNGLVLNMSFDKSNLEDYFQFSYMANPIDNDVIVERDSSIHKIYDDVIEIFEKKMFTSSYLNKVNN